MASGALFFNRRGEILLVKPTYRDGWLIPGGMVELDESPYGACAREVQEEIGIAPPIGQLLCIEYQSAHGFAGDSLQFIFDGGVLDDDAIGQIRLDQVELSDYLWCSEEKAHEVLVPELSERIKWAMVAVREGRVIYLEDKEETG